MATLQDHFVKLVIPFEYSKEYSETISEIRESKYWEQSTCVPRDLFLHAKRLISSEISKNSIGASFLLSEEGRKDLEFPLLKDQFGVLLKKGAEGPDLPDFKIRFSIREVYLYLFETRVGFIVFDIKYVDPESLEAVEMANHQLKKIGLSRSFIYRDGENIEKAKKGKGFFDQFFENLKAFVELVSFFEEENRMLRHCYLFSYLVLDHVPVSESERNSFLAESLFRLRNGFNAHYYPSQTEYDLGHNSQILNFVRNIFWGVSQEGVACIAFLTGEPQQTHFLQKTFIYNAQNSYFYLYVLAMTQRFSLLSISKRTAELPSGIRNSLEMRQNKKEIIKTIDDLQREIVLYGLRINFSQVAYNFHYSLFYEKIRGIFRLDLQHNELDVELKNLGALISIIEEKKQKNFELSILAAAFVFAVVSVLSDGLGFLQFMKWFDDARPLCSLIQLIAIVALILILFRIFMKRKGLFNFFNRKR